MKIQILSEDVSHPAHKAYSYGDSAGLTPDFPFNGACANQIRRKSKGNVRMGKCAGVQMD